mgnify:CR=1 FL=1
MEYNYSDLKKKSVINVSDGKNLGKICDLVISWPDGKVTGMIVPGRKSGLFGGSELIIGFGCIDRIGDDSVLVKVGCPSENCGPCASLENGEEE